MVTAVPTDMSATIRDTKDRLRRQIGDVAGLFAEVEKDLLAEVDAVVAAGAAAFPVVEYDDVAAGTVPASTLSDIRRRGCAVVRGTFPRAQAESWDAELADYLARNNFTDGYAGPADDVFGGLTSSKPQIYPIFWSKPQLQARQSERMATVRTFLNSFWRNESEGRVWFDPTLDTGYPDRIRRREPGSSSKGLSAHTDSGSVERWLLPAYQRVFRHVFAGDWADYDPWDAAHRTDVDEFESTVMCSAFRTFQGWTALSSMQPTDGVLHVVPIPPAMAYLLLRALQDDVAPDDLCGAVNGRVLAVTERWHSALLPALTPIPAVEPGDTVWWHCDVIHSVADVSDQERWGNVMYIPAAPLCEKNARYAEESGRHFLAGTSPGDFAAEDYESTWPDRATLPDLTPAGRAQLSL